MRDRVIVELVKEARKHSDNGHDAVIKTPPTHEEFANRAGTHREAVTKLIGNLRKEGVLEGSRRTLIVPNIGALESCLDSPPRH